MAAAAPHFAGWVGNLGSVCGMCEGLSESSAFPRRRWRRLWVLVPPWGRCLSVPSHWLCFGVKTLVRPLRLDEAPLRAIVLLGALSPRLALTCSGRTHVSPVDVDYPRYPYDDAVLMPIGTRGWNPCHGSIFGYPGSGLTLCSHLGR